MAEQEGETIESTAPKPFVFVLMPFASAFDDVYRLGIKRSAELAGAYAERVDEQHHTDSIVERIYNQISKADAIVADMTGANANVFYEVGYAHALDKPVVILTQNIDAIPFDLKHRPHIPYALGEWDALAERLAPRIRAVLSDGTYAASMNKACPFHLFAQGFQLEPGAKRRENIIPIRSDGEGPGELKLAFVARHSPTPISIDQVFLLTNDLRLLAPSSSRVAEMPREPNHWLAGRQVRDEFVCLYVLKDRALRIPAYGVENLDLPLVLEPGPHITPIRVECSCNGQLYAFEFTVNWN